MERILTNSLAPVAIGRLRATSRLLLMTMLLCTFLGGAKAQETVTIGDGTTNNTYLPGYSYYKYCYSQQIYTAAEIGVAGTINSIAFKNTGAEKTRTYSIYMAHTSKGTFSGNNDWVAMSDNDLVFSGSLTFTVGEWTTIDLDTPFAYNGTSNLIVSVADNTGDYTDSPHMACLVFDATSQAIRAYRDASAYNITTPDVNGTVTNVKNQIVLDITPSGNYYARPTNLSVTTDGATATATWNGTASTYNININGTVTEGVTSPYSFDVELATTYEVMVQAVYSEGISDWTNAVSFTTPLSDDMCEVELVLTDSYGDGWNGNAAIQIVDVQTATVIGTYSNTNEAGAGEAQVYYANVPNGREIQFKWISGNYESECSYVVYDAMGNEIFSGSGAMSTPVNYTVVCHGVKRPQNLAATNVGTTSATLSWTGSTDSYKLQYRTAAQESNMNAWHQVGNDVVATGVLTQYTFDLSGYTGTGAIAIRHYNVSDMFYLNIDDIIVANAEGTTVVSEDFESNSFPSDWEKLDLDGDGYVWELRNPTGNDDYGNPRCNGNYCATSASYYNSSALTPDNWLIIPDVELGGTLTLYARGLDPDYPSENFGVFVTTEDYSAVPAGEWSAEITTTVTSIQLTGLTANTSYEWQVKGINGDEESSWNTSSFTTMREDIKIFTTAGDWNVADNWTPAGVPAITDEVIITADVTIPADVVAVAKRVTINSGSITIEDGGQLKQGAATLVVTMEKEIAGYGTNPGGYYFVASPFTGRTLLSPYNNWSRVDNMISGTYDLYQFKGNTEEEWQNYKVTKFDDGNNDDYLGSGEGYLYASQADKTLLFTGTASLSNNTSITKDFTYDATSTAPFNGWALVGNPYTCNSYLMFGDGNGNMINATFYKMNAAGNGYDKYENYVMLAPGEGAFVKYNTSGKVWYYSDDQGWTIASSGTATLPLLPMHGQSANQDASINLVLADNSPNNSAMVDTYIGLDTNVTLSGRTLWTDGYWNTLCLPFSLSATQIAASPLAGATIKELDGDNSNLSEGTLTLNFVDATSIEAGKPYLVKWEQTPDLTINTTSDWNNFATAVANGNTYAGKLVKLGDDITVSTIVGSWTSNTNNHVFSGTFDGDGHTLTLDLTGSAQGCAPFGAIGGATIINLNTTGTVKPQFGSSNNEVYHASGLVGFANGATIVDCHVSADILFPANATTVHSGGIIGHALSAPFTMTNCLFDGSIDYVESSTSTMTNVGGLVGWDDNSTPNINYCINAGTFANPNVIAKIARVNDRGTIANSFSTIDATSSGSQNDNRGTYTSSIGSDLLSSLGQGWELSGSTVVPKMFSYSANINIVNPVFNGVTIDATTNDVSSSDGKVTFKGNYDYQSFSTDNRSVLLLGDNNSLFWPQSGASLGACRAYFQLNNGIIAGDVQNAVLYFGGGETTGVVLTTDNRQRTTDGAWYTLQGLKLGDNKPTAPGVYIHNGRKVVIK